MMSINARVLVAALALVMVSAAGALAQDVVSQDEISRSLVIRKLKVSNDAISGVLINKSLVPLGNVRLLIRHTFLWKRERSPSRKVANPSRAVYYDVPGTIPGAGVVAFTYKPDPPLKKRKDGRFQTSVQVVGFVEATLEVPE